MLGLMCLVQTLIILYYLYQSKFTSRKRKDDKNFFQNDINRETKQFLPDNAFTKNFDLDILNMVPIPVFTIEITNDKRKIVLHWGNYEAIKFWKKKSFEEMQAIDFSEISEQAMLHLRVPFQYYTAGHKEFIREMFLLYPGGVPKNIIYYYAPILLSNGKLGLLLSVLDIIQTLPSEELQMLDISKKYLSSHVSLYDLQGNLLTRNNNAKVRFVNSKPILEDHFQSTHFSSLILDRAKKASFGDKIFEKEIMYKKESTTSVLLSETFCIRNPVNGDKALFINETDVTKIANMSTYIAKIGHDIKTPLFGIMGMLQCLTIKHLPEDATHCIDMALSSSKSLVELLNDIIDISKLQSGAFNLNIQPTTLRGICQILEEIGNTFYFKLHQNVDLFIDLPLKYASNDKEILLDSLRIKQVITNFTTNAIKFTNKGIITIGIEVQNSKLRFYCKDTGIGIPNDKKKLIFEEYEQSDIEHSKFGTGLGLSIVKSLTELMGGTIGVDSSEGVGSNFYLDIPIKTEIVPNEKKNDFSVLIVGENSQTINYLKDLLKDFCKVETMNYQEITNVVTHNFVIIDNVKESNVHYISKFMSHFKKSKVFPVIDQNQSLEMIKKLLKTKYFLSKPISPVTLHKLLLLEKREEETSEEIKNEWKKDSGTLLLYEPNSKISESLLSVLFTQIIKVETKEEMINVLQTNNIAYVFIVDTFETCFSLTKYLDELKKNSDTADYKIIVSPTNVENKEMDRIKILRAGASEYLKNPFFYETLATVVGKWSKLTHLRIKELIQGYRILIIDDNKINRIVLEKMILSFGENQITLAQNGLEGLELTKKNQFSLIFLDINLPDISGRDLVHKIRDSTREFVPIIAFTAEFEKFDHFDDIVYKPTKLNDLQNILLKWIVIPEGISNKLTEQYLKSNVQHNIAFDGVQLPLQHDIDKIYTEEELQTFNLITIPAYIVSITKENKFKVHWGNEASAKFWKKKNVQDFIENNQFSDASQQTVQMVQRYLTSYIKGRRDLQSELNVIYPMGVATHCQISFAPIRIMDNGEPKTCLILSLFEKDNQLSSDDVRMFFFSKMYSSFFLSLYDDKGDQIMVKNKYLKERFSGIKNLKAHVGEKMSERILSNIPNTEFGQKMMELDLNFEDVILHAEIYLLKDPITGKKGIFIQEHDVTRMRKISKFISTLGHELRNPLNIIYGSLQYFSEVYHNEEKMIHQVLDQTNLLCQYLNNIIEISQIESGFINIYHENVSIDQVIQNVEQVLKPLEKFKLFVQMNMLNSKNFVNLDFISFGKIISKLSEFLKKTECEIEVNLEFKKDLNQSHLLLNIYLDKYEHNNDLRTDLLEAQNIFNFSNTSNFDLNYIILNSLIKICNGEILIEKVNKGTQFNIKIPTSQLDIERMFKFNFEHILIVSNDDQFKKHLTNLLKSLNLVCDTQTYYSFVTDLGYFSLVIFDEPLPQFLEKNSQKNMIVFSKDKTLYQSSLSKPPIPSELLLKLNENLNDFISEKPSNIEKKFSFLIVEDNKVNQNILRKFLEKTYLGCGIEIANNGQEGVDSFKKNKFSLIFMDLNMPVKNGIECTKEIRELDPEAKILIVTANSLVDPKEISQYGVKGIIFKPLVFSSLKEKCENLLV